MRPSAENNKHTPIGKAWWTSLVLTTGLLTGCGGDSAKEVIEALLLSSAESSGRIEDLERHAYYLHARGLRKDAPVTAHLAARMTAFDQPTIDRFGEIHDALRSTGADAHDCALAALSLAPLGLTSEQAVAKLRVSESLLASAGIAVDPSHPLPFAALLRLHGMVGRSAAGTSGGGSGDVFSPMYVYNTYDPDPYYDPGHLDSLGGLGAPCGSSPASHHGSDYSGSGH